MTLPASAPVDFAVRSRRVVTPEGERAGAVLVRGERIVAVVDDGAVLPGTPTEDVGDLVLLPGLVDSHVHVNEPGRTEWEGFESATHAAAAGGVTTLVDMPLNSSPVTTSRDALERKREAAGGRGSVDCAFWGGLVPGNAAEVGQAARRGRVRREGVPGPLRDRRLSRGGRSRPARRAADPGRARQAAAGPRRAGARRGAAGRRSPPLRDLPRVASPLVGARGRGAAAPAVPRAAGADPRRASLGRGRGLARSRGAPRGAAAQRGDLPPLPRARGRGDRRRAHRVQVRAARARARESRRALGRARWTVRSAWWSPITRRVRPR